MSMPAPVDTTTQANVLITFGRSFLTLDLARLLHAAGHIVYTADSVALPISGFSNAVAASFRVAAPSLDPGRWARDLARIARERRIDLVITIHEETAILAQAVGREPALFPEGCELLLPPFEQADALDNKFAFQSMLAAEDVPTLPHALVTSRAELEAVDLGGPFALKQCYSRGSQRVYKVAPDTLPQVEFDARNPWLAQRWAEGPRHCSYSVCRNGQVLAHAVYPVSYAIDGRSCLYYEQIEHPGIGRWVRDRVRASNYTGQIGFDFVEPADGVLYAIECNPRATSGIMLFEPADRVDLAFLGRTDTVITPRMGARKMLGPGMALYGWRKSARGGRTLREFASDLRRADETITRRGDLRPALAVPLAMASILGQALHYRVPLPEAFMHDHEWGG